MYSNGVSKQRLFCEKIKGAILETCLKSDFDVKIELKGYRNG